MATRKTPAGKGPAEKKAATKKAAAKQVAVKKPARRIQRDDLVIGADLPPGIERPPITRPPITRPPVGLPPDDLPPIVEVPPAPPAAGEPPPAPGPVDLPDDRLAGAGFSGTVPALLLPVRIETRWMGTATAPELWVRLFPDVLHVATERNGLDAAEAALAGTFIAAGDDAAARRAAWDELVHLRGAGRAAQAVLDVRAGRPVVEQAIESQTRAHLLPQRFALVLESGAARRVVWGADVPEALPAGLVDPDEPATRWQFDFAAAEAVGLAMRVPFDPAAAGALTRIVALGLRNGSPEAQGQAWAEHLARQFGSAGGELLAVGTPTNNTETVSSAFDSRSRADAVSAALRQLDDALPTDSDGARLARAFGSDETTWRAWPGARARSDAEVAAMHGALWPGTLGPWLRRLLAPAVPAAARGFMQQLFVDDVRARGPLATLRIGRQPYGVLPATALARWSAADGSRQAAVVLRELRRHWAAQAHPPMPGIDGADEDTLRAALAQLPGSRRFALRRLRGSTLRGGPAFAQREQRWAGVQAVFQRLGLAARPELANLFHDPQAWWSRVPAVAAAGADRTQPLAANYLQTLGAPLAAAALRTHAVPGASPASLLYLLVRAGLLEQALDVVEEVFGITSMEVRDHRTDPPTTRTERPWRMLDSGHPRLAEASIGQAMAQVPGVRGDVAAVHGDSHALLAPIRRQRAAVAQLAGLPVGTLERLLHETLDVAGYRLDAWATALATRRVREQRAAVPSGLHVGAWGVVSAPPLPAAPGAPARSEGYELAPSLAHARTAAVLRSGFTHQRAGGTPQGLAVDLGSARLRSALQIVRLARAGQGVGELLGRRLERWLVDHDLGPQTPALRTQAPLPGGRIGIDGAALAAQWQVTPPAPALAEASAQLHEWIDSLADLMLAEAVHHTVNGRRERARAVIEAIERGESLPETLEVAAGPRPDGHTAWRVAVVLPSSGGWPGSAAGVRARAAPQLEAWAAQLLGAPKPLHWLARGLGTNGRERSLKIGPAAAGLTALDVVVLSRRGDTLAALATAAAQAQGIATVTSMVPNAPLQQALVVARLIARVLDGASSPRDDVPAAVARAVDAIGALRIGPAETLRRRAAWAGGEATATTVEERLAAAPAEPAARLESLTGLRCGGAPDAPLGAAQPDLAVALGAPSPSAWLHDLGRVRPALAALGALALARPAAFAGRWSARAEADGTCSVVIGAPAGDGASAALLVLDRWREAAPADAATAALALQVDAPRARAPQTLLLAVSPQPAQPWSLSMLADVVADTLAMLPARLMPPEAVAGQYLPGLYVADDLDGEAFGRLAGSAVRAVPR